MQKEQVHVQEVGTGNGETVVANHSVRPSDRADFHGADLTIYDVIGRLWDDRRVVALFVGAFLIACVIFLAGGRAEYRSSAVLMPEKTPEDGIGSLGALSQFSGLLGTAIPADLLRSSAQIPAELYPEIVKSTAVQLSLLQKEVPHPGTGPITLFEYLDRHKPFSLWESAAEMLSQIPAWISPPAEETLIGPADTSIIRLTRRQLRAVEDLRDRVTADFDIRQGVIKVSAEMPDRELAAITADALVHEITLFVADYRSDRHRRKLEFVSQLHDEARARFDAALRNLATFSDTNRNLSSNRAKTEEQRLQAEYDLSFSLYNSLASRLEEAKIRNAEETPVFKVLQPVTVPIRRSYPPALISLMLSALLGAVVGCGYVFFKPSFVRFGAIFRSRE